MNSAKWPKVKLGDYCDIYQPETITSSEILSTGPYRVYGANGVIGYYDKYNHIHGEIALTCRGATCGTVNFTEPHSWITGNAMVIHPTSQNVLDQKFLYFVLKGSDLKGVITGSAQPQITRGSLSPFLIPLPPIDVQYKIVSELEAATALIEKREEADKKMAAFATALFHKMFGDPRKNERGWEVKKFNEVVEINPSKKKILGLKDDIQVSFVPMSDLNASQDTFTAKEVRDLKNVSKGYTYFQDGDVLLAKITPCFENGKSGIAANLKNEIGFGSTEFIVLRPISGVSISDWIYRFVSREIFLKEGANHMTGTAGQKRISLDWLKEMELPLPPFNLQQEFASRMERVRHLNRKQLVNHKKLEDVFDSMLSNIL